MAWMFSKQFQLNNTSKQHKHSFSTVTFYVWHESSAEGDGGNIYMVNKNYISGFACKNCGITY